ncbi:MAG: siphovirus Gp157 family protein, partial [Oscillospiraceae bacterium]|nr:siphovirus Gp157 family protein [Oscillospiraceae bacterium]
MATLYEIESAIYDCVDSETGEVIDEEKLNALMMERSAKLEGVALWIKNLESDAAAIRAERDNLDKRMKSTENKAKS